MLKVAITSQQPRGGKWSYIQPESGMTFSAYTIPEVIQLVKKHRVANSYPVGVNFNAEVEHGICMMLDEDQRAHFCRQTHEVNSPEEIKARVLTSGDVKSFAGMVAEWIATGHQTVSQEIADARGAECRNCQYNIKAQGCMTCRGAVRAVVGIAGKSTSHDPNLHMCNICGCENRASIWLEKDLQLSYLSEETKKAFPNCWKSPTT